MVSGMALHSVPDLAYEEQDERLRDAPFAIDLGGEDRWAWLTWLAIKLDDPETFLEWEYIKGRERDLINFRHVPFASVIANTR